MCCPNIEVEMTNYFSEVVDMTWEGSFMGVLGKNGVVKVGADTFVDCIHFLYTRSKDATRSKEHRY